MMNDTPNRSASKAGVSAALLEEVFGIVCKWYVSIDYHHAGFVGSTEGSPAWHCMSGFVLQIREHCLLFTAGHVIQRRKYEQSQGAVIDRWQLNDGTAGSSHPPLPYEPELEGWIVIDDREEGLDLAFSVLPAFTARGLLGAGVMPPDSRWWLDRSPFECSPWFVFGTPSETLHDTPTGRVALPTMLSAEPLPDGLPPSVLTAQPMGRRLIYAQLPPSRPLPGKRAIEDPEGMSGGPVIGLFEHDGKATLHIIGIQSGMLERSRIITVCPLQGILEAIDGYLAKRPA